MTPIFLIFPSRGRPKGAKLAVESCLDLAAHPDRVFPIIYVDDDPVSYYSTTLGLRCDLLHGPHYGYEGLHKYVLDLVTASRLLPAYRNDVWYMAFNDDMVMLSRGWDEALTRCQATIVYPSRQGDVPPGGLTPPKIHQDKTVPCWRASTDISALDMAAYDVWFADKFTSYAFAHDIVFRHDHRMTDHARGL